MVRHNNIIPNQHFHKKWAGGASGKSRGPLHVVSWFDQAAKKKVRHQKRVAKAAKMAPRPTGGLLRPVVHCPTQKYNAKARLGRGFSADELKAAGIPVKFARTIGIAVDMRRTNKSEEALQTNIQRLQEYKSKLVVFPRRKDGKPSRVFGGKHAIRESTLEEAKKVNQFKGTVNPIVQPTVEFPMVPLTDEMKKTSQHGILCDAKNEKKLVGIRVIRKLRKAAREAAKKK